MAENKFLTAMRKRSSEIAEHKKRLAWLQDHPVWFDHSLGMHRVSAFSQLVSFEYVFVDPSTERIEDEYTRNTSFRVWIEAGPYTFVEELGEWRSGHPGRSSAIGRPGREALRR